MLIFSNLFSAYNLHQTSMIADESFTRKVFIPEAGYLWSLLKVLYHYLYRTPIEVLSCVLISKCIQYLINHL